MRAQADILYIHIIYTNLCISVAISHASRCSSHFKAGQAIGVIKAADRLALLYRKTRVLLAEAFRCVHLAHIMV